MIVTQVPHNTQRFTRLQGLYRHKPWKQEFCPPPPSRYYLLPLYFSNESKPTNKQGIQRGVIWEQRGCPTFIFVIILCLPVSPLTVKPHFHSKDIRSIVHLFFLPMLSPCMQQMAGNGNAYSLVRCYNAKRAKKKRGGADSSLTT